MAPQGYFTDDSMLRRVVGDRVTALSGQRALLVMAAHPVAFAGFFAHTGALDDPYARLERTATVMNAIAFGTRAQADRMTAHVRSMHRRVRGTLSAAAGPFPAGTPYRGDDPEHLLWILGALAESAMLVYAKYARTLSRDEKDELWRDYRVVGRLFGLRERDMPQDAAGFEAYMAGRYASPELVVTPQARELAIGIVLRPPVPLHLRPVLELANQITVGLLPPRVREQYGFSWDPLRAVALHGGAEYVKRVVVPVLPERVRMLPLARAA
ncbi:MAG TPA: oxygenase MpaB family protein [Patescibacteria group bacterium]|nr:oxygenase MpaB family protein [Patescibacteria group bacterium]